MAISNLSFEELKRAVGNGDLRPVYLLHGREGYYTDCLVRKFEEIIPEEDRDFGLTVVYATQTEPSAIVDICRRLPMMSDRQTVIVKEAQAVKADYFEKLIRYVASPTPSTVLVIAARGDDARCGKAFLEAVAACGGVVFQSKPVYESQIPPLISAYIRERGLRADDKAVGMLHEFIGTDLSRLYNEIDKLAEILGPGAMVTPEAVERNIGVSKDYNSFELVDAVAARDLPRMYRIADYFAANPRQNPVQPVAAALFGFFADLLVAYYAADRSERGLMGELGTRNSFAVKRVMKGMLAYNAFQVVAALSEIRRFDRMSKGGGSRQDGHLLFKDLLFRLVTATGR